VQVSNRRSGASLHSDRPLNRFCFAAKVIPRKLPVLNELQELELFTSATMLLLFVLTSYDW
jgi:hypothetical protein